MSLLILLFVTCVLSIHYDARTITSECHSFYNYVCDEESKHDVMKSYFTSIRKKNDEIVKRFVIANPIYSDCLLKIRTESKRIEHRLKDSRPLRKKYANASELSSFLLFKTGSFSKISTIFWISQNIKKNIAYDSFPVVLKTTKRLDESSICLELSPNVRWLERSKRLIDSIDSLTGWKNNELTLLSNFVNLVYDKFVKITNEINLDSDDSFVETYIKRYKTVESLFIIEKFEKDGYPKRDVETIMGIWIDVIMGIYSSRNVATCIHDNGYIEFYVALLEIMMQFESANNEVDFLEMLNRFSKELNFDTSYSILRSESTCETIVKAVTLKETNDAFLSSKKYRDDVFKIEEALNELKLSINRTVTNNPSLPDHFKRRVWNKLKNMKYFILNKKTTVEESEDKCYDRKESLEFDEYIDCFTRSYWKRESKRLKMNRDEKYSTTDAHEERYSYLYHSTDISMVNAWYDPVHNEITIPAGILDFPIYSGDDMYDYARIGMILAHELGHSIDPNGLCWDEKGNYDSKGLYCKKVNLPFVLRKNLQCLTEDYGHPCNEQDGYGERTLGEDAADQLGLVASWDVFYRKYAPFLRLEDKREFFRRYALLWCNGQRMAMKKSHFSYGYKIDDESKIEEENEYDVSNRFLPFLVKRLKTKGMIENKVRNDTECEENIKDVHALPKHRVNKTLRQMHIFSRLFNCKKGSKMYKEEPCVIY